MGDLVEGLGDRMDWGRSFMAVLEYVSWVEGLEIFWCRCVGGVAK